MGVRYSGRLKASNLHHSPKIDTKDLKFYIDISNRICFTPGSTVLNSITNGSLNIYNSPSYTSDSLIFNGADQSAYTNNHSISDINVCTINLWIKFYSTLLTTPSYIPFWVSDSSGRMIFIYTAPNLNYILLCTENKSINKKIYFSQTFQSNKWYNISILKNGSNFIAYQDLNINTLQESNQGYVGLWNTYNNSLSLGAGLFAGDPVDYCPVEISKFYIYGVNYSNQQIKNHYNVYKSKFNIAQV
jgi:hypothetical protein